MRGGKRSVLAANVFLFRLAQAHSCTIFFSQDRIELRRLPVCPGIYEFLRDRPYRDGISWPIPERHPEWRASSLDVECQESRSEERRVGKESRKRWTQEFKWRKSG